MASAAVSTCVDYNQPAVTTVVTKHCGEVYCSEKLEDFVVICTKCSQVFTLHSSNLFIKHMQSCLSVGRRDLGLEIQTNPNCTIDISTPSEHCDKFDEGTCSKFDPLSPVKVKTEISDDEVNLGEYKAEAVFIDPFVETEEIFDQYLRTESEDDHLPLVGEDKDEEEENEDDISKTITLSIIDEYEKHPLLWDINLFRGSCRSSRFLALQEITNAINIKHNKSFDVMTIRRKIFLLRDNYRRVIRTKEAFEREHPNEDAVFPIHLHYFDQISFIGTAFNDAQLCPSSTEQVKEPDSDEPLLIESDERSGRSDEKEPDLYQGPLSRNRELLTCIVEEYKKQPNLWSSKHFGKCHTVRRTAYAKMAKAIHKRTDVKFPIDRLSLEIRRLRSAYFRVVRSKEQNPTQRTLLWYANILSFIENNDDVDEAVEEDNNVNSDDDYSISESEEFHQKRKQHQSKEHIFAIIELYQAAPILWDTSHAGFAIRCVRREAFENILSTLSSKHDCHLTADQLRYQLRYIKECYFRALRYNTAAENADTANYKQTPFFYDRLSFLKPFANRQQKTAPKLQTNIETDPIEDFTYLTENRPLMMSFIELYEEQGCLWDQKHKDLGDPSAESEAYDKIVNMFLRNDVVVTKEKVISAIGYLHSIVVNTPKENKEPVWFYESLKFLGKANQVVNKYCTHCNTQFRTLRQYEKHKIEIAGDFPYKCALCGKGFLTRSRYFYHQNTHKAPLKCDLCDFTASCKTNFKIHMHRHNRVTPHRCPICDKSFVTTTELRRHNQKHTGEKPFICEICGKKLPANSEYHLHMRRHRNQRDHKCEVCGSAFFDTESLQNHMVVHSDERKYTCDVCGATFKLRFTLAQHKKLHDEKKRYACKICGKCFAQQAGLYSHMKSHCLVVENSFKGDKVAVDKF